MPECIDWHQLCPYPFSLNMTPVLFLIEIKNALEVPYQSRLKDTKLLDIPPQIHPLLRL